MPTGPTAPGEGTHGQGQAAPFLDLSLVREAADRIAGQVLRTPVLKRTVGQVILACKAENLQPVGSFKLRGALNFVRSLPEEGQVLVAHSSGNHAQAVAAVGSLTGRRVIVVMPETAPALKVERTRAMGAEVVFVGPDSQERLQVAEELARRPGHVLVPPYDHPLVAAGQGTAALELLEDTGPLERFYCPVSGGGLMAGCGTVLRALAPGCEVVGVEPASGPDTKLSLEQGRRVAVPPPETIADGLCVRVPGTFTFPVLREVVDRVELVEDPELLETVAWALSELRLVLEPSGAAALAVARREAAAEDRPGRWGVLLSGGNLDPGLWPSAVARLG